MICELPAQYEVDLISFCDKEGDDKGIRKILTCLSDEHHKCSIGVYRYNGDIEKILGLFARAEYIVASRFHAMIIGMLYGKPIFPICYGAKMIHYLEDIGFTGKIGKPNSLKDITVEDVLFNLKHNIVAQCEQHKDLAYLQFEGLRMYLENGEGRQ